MYSLSHSFKRIMSEVRFLSVRSLSKAPMQQANTSLVHCLINFCLYTPYSYSWGVIARNRLILAMLLILDVLRGINVNDMAILSFAYNCYHKSKKKKEIKDLCLSHKAWTHPDWSFVRVFFNLPEKLPTIDGVKCNVEISRSYLKTSSDSLVVRWNKPCQDFRT